MPTRILWLLLAVGVGADSALSGQEAVGDGQEPITAAAFEEAIGRSRASMLALLERGGIPGMAVAVGVSGELVWSEGFGVANLEHDVPVTRETLFGIGSISKVLTMAAAGSLVDEGRLDLDQGVEASLPGFPHRDVTVRLLAAHQSGLSDDSAGSPGARMSHCESVGAAAREIASREHVVSEPGTEVAYATGLYSIIGAVLEVADGRPYEELMAARVLSPAGMLRTRLDRARRIVKHRTAFYVQEEGEVRPVPDLDPSCTQPGAGFLSTPEDLVRFGMALLEGRIVSEVTREALFEEQSTRDSVRTGFGLGFRVAVDDKGRRVVHVPGGGPGISCWLMIYPEARVVLAITSNLTQAPVGGREFGEVQELFLEQAERLGGR